jgi:CubicO group peptidase (beta-lactamase class C family)
MRWTTANAAWIAALAVSAPGLHAAEPLAVCAPTRVALVSQCQTKNDFAWQTAAPEAQGFSAERLTALQAALAGRGTKAFLVIRDDRIVLEWYAKGHGPMLKHYIASVSKPVVGGLALALAVADRRLDLDDKASRFAASWADDPRKSKITIRHLGSHTSGLADAEENDLAHDKLTGWKGDFWKRLKPPHDPFTIARDQTPVLFEPGSKFQYSNPGIAMLGYCITAALKDTPERDLRTLLRNRIMRPIGIHDDEWAVGYGQTVGVDGLPLVAPWGGGNFTARALARIGRLMLRQGDWQGQPIIAADAVRLTTNSAGLPGACGMGWWTNADGRYEKLPRDAYWAAGAGHQILLVVPSLKLIAVRQGGALAGRAEYHKVLYNELFAPLMDTLTHASRKGAKAQRNDDLLGAFASLRDGCATGAEIRTKAPYPPSKIITGIDWAPRESIIRLAKDSDNWPMTWADDDQLYTAYGDGYGFTPRTPYKIGLGFAKVLGIPPDIKGVNIRAPEAENKQWGAKGKKASGMLMVDGVLYLWVRNAGNSQLGWSTDYAKTWTWSHWKFTSSFGCPTLLNFGKNYAGARDGFVYLYSHDHDSAYLPADRMVLARVMKERIKDRGAYEFFQRLDDAGNPVWTPKLDERGAVFTNPGKCYRSGVTYNAVLKRYLWCQTLFGKDTRFEGGLGIYDAPEPWGPWTTVFYTEKWDVGPGETSSFPTKWMSADGKTLHLVFSGDDYFAVRRAELRVSTSPR